MEIRYVNAGEEERLMTGKTEAECRMENSDKGKKFLGYFAVYNSRSVDLGGFVEVIKPGAFNRNFGPDADVRSIYNHNRDCILGRTKNGTLRLSGNNKGGLAECDLDERRTYDNDLIISLGRGDIDGMSFGFRTISDNWMVKDGINVRELLDVKLSSADPVTFPAYQATSVSLRSELEGSEVKEMLPLCAALIRLDKKLEIQERDADLIVEYRSVIPGRFEDHVSEITKMSKRAMPLDLMRMQIELLEAELTL